MSKICILTGAHLCCNPRVVKEASALADAGHDVTVLGPAFSEELAALDAKITSAVRWKHEFTVDLRVNYINIWDRLALRLSRRLARVVIRYIGLESAPALGYGLSRMRDIALKKNADFYIAHQEVGLWVGCELLKAGKRVGADFEDWYSRDLLPEAQAFLPRRLLQRCERYMLNYGAFSLTTSDAMASALAATYVCPKPTVIYNAFPWADRESLDNLNKDRTDSSRTSIHWVSQTIGPGRGLELLCQALCQVAVPVDVHVRGNCSLATESWLRNQFSNERGHSLFLHELVPPEELLSRIAEHDIGLALEQYEPDSRNLTITNKILHYLLAGLAVVATDTLGQAEVANAAPEAVRLFAGGDVDSLARQLNTLVSSPEKLTSAKAAARKAAEDIFCFEVEQVKLLNIIHHGLTKLISHHSFNLPILLYHNIVSGKQPDLGSYEISIESFCMNLDVLNKLGYSTITFAQLHRILKGDETPPHKMAIITFDDAFESFFDLALPELVSRGMNATVFVPAAKIGLTNSWDNKSGVQKRRIMDEEMLHIAASQGIEIGSHGWNHRNLLQCNDTELREEIFSSRQRFREMGFDADFFAYPFGDFSPRFFPLLQEAGYLGATSIFSNESSVTKNPFAMRRVYIHEKDTQLSFRLKLMPLYLRYKAWRGFKSLTM